MNPAKKKRPAKVLPLLCGFLVFAVGAALFLLNSPRRVRIVQDGVSLTVRTYKITVGQILREAGIAYGSQDFLFPKANFWMTENYAIRIDHAKTIALTHYGAPSDFTTRQAILGNMLLAGGVMLFPGDRVLWNGRKLQPGEVLGSVPVLRLSVEHAGSFQLKAGGTDEPRTVYADGATVGEALAHAGLAVPGTSKVIPAIDTPFSDGMTIAILEPVPLTVAVDGKTVSLMGYGTTVGEALAQAGLPLSGLNETFPAEDEPLPADGVIRVVRVVERVAVQAKTIPFATEWTADETLDLDQTVNDTPGRNGLVGTTERTRTEDGVQLPAVVNAEKELLQPVSAVSRYGTKISVRTLSTPQGAIDYWRAIPVYATSYSPCRSGVAQCVNGTASGRKVDIGVVAVAVSWYNRMAGLPVYIPDYGAAVIGDTGRSPAADNRWVDLAYNDENFVPWSRNTTLYFLTPVPSEITWILP